MKTAIKITAIAVITVLAALSCSDGVGLTQRDFKEIRDAKDPKYDNVTYGSYVPTFDYSGLTYVSSGSPTDAQKEMTISFPNSADILGKDIKTADIKEFISMYTFTNGSSGHTEVSTKESDVDFEFVRRVRQADDTEDVVIKLATVPSKTFVVKVDATKYTFANGLKLDYDGDNVAGEAVYDDYYETITPDMAASTGDYTNPRLDFSLEITAEPETAALNTQNITVATLNLGGYHSASTSSQKRAIIESLIPKIKFQKYDTAGKTWTDTGTIRSDDDSGDWQLVVNITPQDGDIYRTYATGMKGLTTADNYLNVKQKIKVRADGSYYGQGTYKYTFDTVISNPIMFRNPNRHIQDYDHTPVDSSYPVTVSSDGNGKNIKLEIYFQKIEVAGSPHWLKDLDIETFKKNFKLVYNHNDPGSPFNYVTPNTLLDDLVFIPIKEVKYESHNPQNLSPTPGKNKITITLDPSYQLSKDRNRTISLLLAPGFKYDNDLITFGDYSANGALGLFIDGTNFWEGYGAITGSNGELKL